MRRSSSLVPQRLCVQLLCALLFLCLGLSACGKTGENPTAQGEQDASRNVLKGLGEINQEAALTCLRLESFSEEGEEESGQAVIYREVQDLEALVTSTARPILITVYQPGMSGNDQLITFMEQSCERFAKSAILILARSDARDNFLAQFPVNGWPSLILLKEGKKLRQLEGLSDENLMLAESFLQHGQIVVTPAGSVQA